MLFHVRARLKPPPSPGTLMSDWTTKVLPVDRLIGAPASKQAMQILSGASAGAPQLGVISTPRSPSGTPPGLHSTSVAGKFVLPIRVLKPQSIRHELGLLASISK